MQPLKQHILELWQDSSEVHSFFPVAGHDNFGGEYLHVRGLPKG